MFHHPSKKMILYMLGAQILLFFHFFLLELSFPKIFMQEAYIIPLRNFRESVDEKGLVRIAKILRNRGPQPAGPELGPKENFGRFASLVGLSPEHYLDPRKWIPKNWKELGNDLKYGKVTLSYFDSQGKTVIQEVITDDEGHVLVHPKEMGKSPILISLSSSDFYAIPKEVSLFSIEDFTGDTLYFTDHDDTVKFTGIMKIRGKTLDSDGDQKRSLSKNSLLRVLISNPYDWYCFPGSAEMAKAITQEGKIPMLVITGSPIFLSEDLVVFYRLHGFPEPQVLSLRNLQDGLEENPDPRNAYEYKIKTFEKALDMVVAKGKVKRIIFDGDRGEKDPEVALALAQKYSQLEFIVTIHNITSDSKKSQRFEGFSVLKNVKFVIYDNKYEAARLLKKMGVISAQEAEMVKEAIIKSNRKIEEKVGERRIRKKPGTFSFLPSRDLSFEELRENHLYFPGFGRENFPKKK